MRTVFFYAAFYTAMEGGAQYEDYQSLSLNTI